MKKTLQQIMDEGEPLMQAAVDALRAYHLALREGLSAGEIERLRLEAEARFTLSSEYQQSALHQVLHSFH
ncbi:hypothetical protein PPUJ20005_38330 [Pseudomonas putida]|uniref:hypothetical protein n=1 Tax=Pseudomonas putida TaxID=303 RepID=UPI00235D62D1|nr:hypothetical protein [Pseudomonas putida]GLO09864.1 hypothetical protein PPUJ20005_38330 [Pseudomonas putida]HDS0987050.1 hypothetical protein [Pseudomonas putida]